MLKNIILTGSYNLHGTSNTLVDEFIRGAKKNGNEIVRFDTDHLNFHHCIGCNHCGTVGMIPDHFYNDSYELGKKIK